MEGVEMERGDIVHSAEKLARHWTERKVVVAFTSSIAFIGTTLEKLSLFFYPLSPPPLPEASPFHALCSRASQDSSVPLSSVTFKHEHFSAAMVPKCSQIPLWRLHAHRWSLRLFFFLSSHMGMPWIPMFLKIFHQYYCPSIPTKRICRGQRLPGCPHKRLVRKRLCYHVCLKKKK